MANQDIYLLLGSNEGDPVSNLAVARENIAKFAGTITAQSSLYESAAWGLEQQPDFCNQAIRITSTLTPEKLLDTVLEIEKNMGRVRREKWGQRIIDIDVLFYGGTVIDTPLLKIPHPGIPERKFALKPLAEIAPGVIHPVLKKPIATLLEECADPLRVDKL